MITTALQLRMRRARELVEEDAVHLNGGPGQFDVTSQSNPAVQYHVQIVVDADDEVRQTHCDCPDWQRMCEALNEWIEATAQSPQPGISHVNYSPLCKHVGAALIQLGVLE